MPCHREVHLLSPPSRCPDPRARELGDEGLVCLVQHCSEPPAFPRTCPSILPQPGFGHTLVTYPVLWTTREERVEGGACWGRGQGQEPWVWGRRRACLSAFPSSEHPPSHPVSRPLALESVPHACLWLCLENTIQTRPVNPVPLLTESLSHKGIFPLKPGEAGRQRGTRMEGASRLSQGGEW